MQTVLVIAIIALAAGLVWAYRKGYQDAVDNCGASKSELDAYREGYEAAEAIFRHDEADVAVYVRGFENGFKIGNMKDKQAPNEVAVAMREPVQPVTPDPKQEEERRRMSILLHNIAAFDGTERGQQDVK
jgi:hypothetical protein